MWGPWVDVGSDTNEAISPVVGDARGQLGVELFEVDRLREVGVHPSLQHDLSRSPAIAFAVNAMIGTLTAPPSSSTRIARVASYPSIRGMWQSIRIASYRPASRLSLFRAFSPFTTASTS